MAPIHISLASYRNYTVKCLIDKCRRGGTRCRFIRFFFHIISCSPLSSWYHCRFHRYQVGIVVAFTSVSLVSLLLLFREATTSSLLPKSVILTNLFFVVLLTQSMKSPSVSLQKCLHSLPIICSLIFITVHVLIQTEILTSSVNNIQGYSK